MAYMTTSSNLIKGRMQTECSIFDVKINLLSPHPSYEATCPTAMSYQMGRAACKIFRQKDKEQLVHMLRQGTRVLLDGLESLIQRWFPPQPIPGKILRALHRCPLSGATIKSKEEWSLSYAARLEIIQKCASTFQDRRAASAVKKRATVTISDATAANAWWYGRNGTSRSCHLWNSKHPQPQSTTYFLPVPCQVP